MKKYRGFMVGTLVGGLTVALVNATFSNNNDELGKEKDYTQRSLLKNTPDPMKTSEKSGAQTPEPVSATMTSTELSSRNTPESVSEPTHDEQIESSGSDLLQETENSTEELEALKVAEQQFIDNYPKMSAEAVQQIEIVVTQAMARGEWLTEDNEALRPFSPYISPEVMERVFKPLFDAAVNGSLQLSVPIIL